MRRRSAYRPVPEISENIAVNGEVRLYQHGHVSRLDNEEYHPRRQPRLDGDYAEIQAGSRSDVLAVVSGAVARAGQKLISPLDVWHRLHQAAL